MLVLTRKESESFVIGGGTITITVVAIKPDRVRIGIDAPREITVHRKEIQDLIDGKREEPPLKPLLPQRK